jgi:hypothetical protein
MRTVSFDFKFISWSVITELSPAVVFLFDLRFSQRWLTPWGLVDARQCPRISQARNKAEVGAKRTVCFLLGLLKMEIVQTSTRLHGVTFQKTVFFIVVLSVFNLKPEMDFPRVLLIATPFGFQWRRNSLFDGSELKQQLMCLFAFREKRGEYKISTACRGIMEMLSCGWSWLPAICTY